MKKNMLKLIKMVKIVKLMRIFEVMNMFEVTTPGMPSCFPTPTRRTTWTSSSGSWRPSGIQANQVVQLYTQCVKVWRRRKSLRLLRDNEHQKVRTSTIRRRRPCHNLLPTGIAPTRAWCSWWEASSTWWPSQCDRSLNLDLEQTQVTYSPPRDLWGTSGPLPFLNNLLILSFTLDLHLKLELALGLDLNHQC